MFICDPVGIRTQDPQLRRLLLYPAELPDHSHSDGLARLNVSAEDTHVACFPNAAAKIEKYLHSQIFSITLPA